MVTVHGLNYKTPKWKGFGAKFIQLGEQIAAKYADRNNRSSKEQKEYFQKNIIKETNYIPNGVAEQPREKAVEITKNMD